VRQDAAPQVIRSADADRPACRRRAASPSRDRELKSRRRITSSRERRVGANQRNSRAAAPALLAARRERKFDSAGGLREPHSRSRDRDALRRGLSAGPRRSSTRPCGRARRGGRRFYRRPTRGRKSAVLRIFPATRRDCARRRTTHRARAARHPVFDRLAQRLRDRLDLRSAHTAREASATSRTSRAAGGFATGVLRIDQFILKSSSEVLEEDRRLTSFSSPAARGLEDREEVANTCSVVLDRLSPRDASGGFACRTCRRREEVAGGSPANRAPRLENGAGASSVRTTRFLCHGSLQE